MIALAAHFATRGLSQAARNRVIRVLGEHYNADVQVQSLQVTLFPEVRVEGAGLTLRPKGRPDAPPLLTIGKLSLATSIPQALEKPPRIRQVRLDGLHIQFSHQGQSGPHQKKAARKTPDFLIDSVIADGTKLTVIPRDRGKSPLEFDIRQLSLRGAGPSEPMPFRASLRNAEPPGDIQTTGKFGPWARDDPGETPVTGNYIFRDADLSVFPGIAGKLSSDGSYRGALDCIEVDGHADVPDFMLKASGNPVHLMTQFHAIVDGTDGNTSLQPVDAQFGDSRILARGAVESQKGAKGKTVSLDVQATGKVEDILRLVVKGEPPLTGAIGFRAKLQIPPGKEDIVQKMQLAGTFGIHAAQTPNLNVQEKLNEISHKGKGEPKEPDTRSVVSDLAGQFALDRGVIAFRQLSFRVPGVAVSLQGRYDLINEKLNLHGTATLQAKVSQTTTGIKSLLLKPFNALFRKGNAGAVIPFKITGTRDHPHFGPDLHKP